MVIQRFVPFACEPLSRTNPLVMYYANRKSAKEMAREATCKLQKVRNGTNAVFTFALRFLPLMHKANHAASFHLAEGK